MVFVLHSIGEILVKSGIVVGTVSMAVWSFNNYSNSKKNYQHDVRQVALMTDAKAKLVQSKPKKQAITTGYQQALNIGNKLLALQQEYVQADTSRKQKLALAKLNSYIGDNTTLSRGFYTAKITNWHGTVNYGNMTSSGRINLILKYYDDHDTLMEVVTMQYDIHAHKVYGVVVIQSQDGLKAVQNYTMKG